MNALSPKEIVRALKTLLGDAGVISDPVPMTSYVTEPRKRFKVWAVAVALPADIPALQALCRWANQHGVPLIPQSGNTGLVGGQVPLSGNEVIVNISRLNKVREVNAAAGHMTLEAGVILEEAHKVAQEAGAMFPLWLASQGSARIGGVLSSNAGGVQVLAFGNARELTLGVEAVLADGRLYNGLNALNKDNTGYDLKDLLVGAEGTLGFITAATVKLFPIPEGHETAIVNVTDPAAALQLFYLLRERTGSRLTAFELMNRFGVDLQLKYGLLPRDPTASLSPWYALVEVNRMKGGVPGALQSALEEALGSGLVADAVVAESEADRTLMWAAREQMSEVQSKEGASIKHDVSVPIGAVPELIAVGIAAVEKVIPGVRPCPFGHMGDGNIHFNLSQPVGADPKDFMAREADANAAIYTVVKRLGGSVSAEHGIGQLKRELLKEVKDPVALDMMRAIKAALDPNGILNPGKVL
ncbi:FAD-binding oxidoreductase [Devosia sp. CN2-171]|uniref:FAD-binding oxidoreductase n=1 Tax=Devosia sp. CN2-171 TaxID=3400909 RepID=UPI003BF8A87F